MTQEVQTDKLPIVISLTSWKARIETAGKTVYSLVRSCNPWKICLTLASEEFPKRESELPVNILILIKTGVLEIIWTDRDVKCFKKILFAMKKYKDFPIVSADDDCIYTENYAKVLYEHWLKDKKSIWTFRPYRLAERLYVHGPAAIYPPNCFGDSGLEQLYNKNILRTWHDDVFYSILAWKLGIEIKPVINSKKGIYVFHDDKDPLHKKLTTSVSYATMVCLKEIQITEK